MRKDYQSGGGYTRKLTDLHRSRYTEKKYKGILVQKIED